MTNQLSIKNKYQPQLTVFNPMKINVIFSEEFEVDENSNLSPEEQGIIYIQQLLDERQLRVVGDSLFEVTDN